jgi:hypothetical protein
VLESHVKSWAIGTLSKVLFRDRPLISSIVLSLGIISILASYLSMSLDRLYEVSVGGVSKNPDRFPEHGREKEQ